MQWAILGVCLESPVAPQGLPQICITPLSWTGVAAGLVPQTRHSQTLSFLFPCLYAALASWVWVLPARSLEEQLLQVLHKLSVSRFRSLCWLQAVELGILNMPKLRMGLGAVLCFYKLWELLKPWDAAISHSNIWSVLLGYHRAFQVITILVIVKQ